MSYIVFCEIVKNPQKLKKFQKLAELGQKNLVKNACFKEKVHFWRFFEPNSVKFLNLTQSSFVQFFFFLNLSLYSGLYNTNIPTWSFWGYPSME